MPSFSNMKSNRLQKEYKAAGLPTDGSHVDWIQRSEEDMERISFVNCNSVPSAISFPTSHTQANSRVELNTFHLCLCQRLHQHEQSLQRTEGNFAEDLTKINKSVLWVNVWNVLIVLVRIRHKDEPNWFYFKSVRDFTRPPTNSPRNCTYLHIKFCIDQFCVLRNHGVKFGDNLITFDSSPL